jgi:type IV secretion system protein VirB10
MNQPVPEQSPDMLPGNSARDAGVRRLNRVPLLIVLMLGALVTGAIGYTYYARVQSQQHEFAEAEATVPQGANANVLFKDAPDAGLIKPDLPAPVVPPPSTPVPLEKAPPQVNGSPDYGSAWQAYRQQQLQIAEAREQAALSALSAASDISVKNVSASAIPLNVPPAGPAAPLPAAPQNREASGDLNQQAAKREFLSTIPHQGSADYLPAGLHPPVTPYEIKAGTVIPAVMTGGIDSDLPGQIIGQVSENVYDTATGHYLLIPQGSKLVGSYDSSVTAGQDRVLVAWHRLIYPDASSLDLGAMPGADQGGYAGFSDEVDNHYLTAFGNALLLSAFSAGIQLSQPQASNGQNYSSSQVIAGAVGQQLGALGSEIARRNLQIQPTLTIRPGYRFNVIVTKDMTLEPWKGNAP